MRKLRAILPLLAGLGAMAALMFCPETAADSARRGLRICGEMLIPSLLPFFVVSALLRAWGLPGVLGRLLGGVTARIWGMSGAGVSAFLLGITGGYPLGAAAIGQLRRDGGISREEAQRALCFCNNTGPAFLIGAAGAGVFHSSGIGLLLYGAHVLAAVMIGMVTAPKQRIPAPAERTYISIAGFSEALTDAVKTSVETLLTVCGFVVIFSVMTGLLQDEIFKAAGWISAHIGMELTSVKALLTGVLELGGGLGAMEGLSPTAGNLALASFLIGFGGLSVQAQSAAVLRGTDLRLTFPFFCKLAHGVLSALLTVLLFEMIS